MKYKNYFLLIAGFLMMTACQGLLEKRNTGQFQEITAIGETDPVGDADDAADDPSIWIHPTDPERSLFFCSNKQSGIVAYDLSGKQVGFYPVGRINNIDVRQNIRLNDTVSIDLVAASNRTDNSITLMEVQLDGSLEDISARPVISALEEVYGFCLYHDLVSRQVYAIVNDKKGYVEMWRLYGTDELKLDAGLAVTFRGGNSQLEGCVADDELGYLYIGEEGRGIWKYYAHPDSAKNGTLVDEVSSDHLQADIEGLAIYKKAEGKGYLLVSSQGNNSFAVYRREGRNEYLGSFVIASGSRIDGVSETDGIEVTSVALGSNFPKGVFIAQDGQNNEGKQVVNQNFKWVDWQKIAEALNLD